MKKTRKIKVIGAGGIGTYVIEPLARYLSYSEDNCEITVIDGDKYEEKNRERQRFTALENKAEHTVNRHKSEFPKVHFRAKGEYLTPDNIIPAIREGDTVMMCVDNHATRKLVSDRCNELRDVTLISGGNDYIDGNVAVHIRRNGKDVTKSITELHPEIKNFKDKNPGTLTDAERQGCQQEAQTNPQLLFTNLAIASMMLNVYRRCEKEDVDFDGVYVDINTLCNRKVPEKNILF